MKFHVIIAHTPVINVGTRIDRPSLSDKECCLNGFFKRFSKPVISTDCQLSLSSMVPIRGVLVSCCE